MKMIKLMYISPLLITFLFYQKAIAQSPALAPEENQVIFSGGYDTLPQDKGRPVILIASALAVTPVIFRNAFSKVTPAQAGEEPKEKQVRLNKKALMDALSPYGITDDKLNQVSNYYRFASFKGQVWKHNPAKATVVMANGKVTSLKILDGGNGYTSATTVTIVGSNLKIKAVINFDTDFNKNGSITGLDILQ